jgi:hypothetical protein
VEQMPNAKGAAFPDANICFKGSPVNSCVYPYIIDSLALKNV